MSSRCPLCWDFHAPAPAPLDAPGANLVFQFVELDTREVHAAGWNVKRSAPGWTRYFVDQALVELALRQAEWIFANRKPG